MRKLLVIAATIICFGQSEIINLTSNNPSQTNLKPAQSPKVKTSLNNKNLSTQRESSTQNPHPFVKNSLYQEPDMAETELYSQNVEGQINTNSSPPLVTSDQSPSVTNKKITQKPSYYQTSSTQSAPINDGHSHNNSKVQYSPVSNREHHPIKKQQSASTYSAATSTLKSSYNQLSANKTKTVGKSVSSPSANITNARTIQKSSSSSLNIPVNAKPVSNYQKSSHLNTQKTKNSYIQPRYNKNDFKGKGNIIDGQKNSGSGAGNVILGQSNQVNGNLNQLSGNSNAVYGQQNLIKASSNIVVGLGNIIN